MNFRVALPIAGFIFALAFPIYYAVNKDEPKSTPSQVVAVDDAKALILSTFKAEPNTFDFEAASELLASSRLAGEFSVCSAATEATGDQYIEISRLVDKYEKDIHGLQLALNKALKGDGITDCDYRVLMTVVNDHKRTLMAGPNKAPDQSSAESRI